MNQRTLRVYDLAAECVRLDTTSASGYWEVTADGVFQFGHSKDHRPDLPQVKVLLATLDPFGMPLVTQVVSRAKADDPLYTPAIDQMRTGVGRRGLLYALAFPLFPWRSLRPWECALTVVATVAMLAVLVLTKSRGGLMAMAATLVVLAALRWRHGWLAAPLALVAGGLAAWHIGLSKVADALSTAQMLGGMDGRLEVWSRALYMIQDFPFTGIGMGTFKQVANSIYPFFLAGPDAEIPHAHNIFLQVGVDLGLPGLVAWLALLILVCVCAWLVYGRGRRQGDAVLAALGAGLLASQAALVVHDLTDASTWATRPAVVVWAMWGLAMAAFMLVNKEEEPSGKTTE